jgi:O-antigen/teichoic acid export membrane protein
MLKTSAPNIILRGSTMISKFLLLLVMARYLPASDVGIYGLFAGTVAIAVYVLGLDFYVYNTREILAHDGVDRVVLIRDQLIFHGIAYAVVLPLLLGVFVGRFIPWQYIGWFYGVLVFEHLSQESYRILIILSRPIAANIVLSLRTGAWIWPIVAGLLLVDRTRGIGWILGGWLIGAAVSVVLAAGYLSRLPWAAAWRALVGWRAMRAAVVGAVPFFVGTLALRGVEYTDRYFVEHYAGSSLVGVYTFYWSIASVVQTLVLTGVIEILYPRIVEAYQNGEMARYRALMRRMALGSATAIVFGGSVVVSAIIPVLHIVRRPLYAANIGVLWLLLASAVVSIAAWIPRYALYVRRRDLLLLLANVVGLVTSLSANAWLVPRFGVYGAGIASILSNAAIGLTILGALFKVARYDYAAA